MKSRTSGQRTELWEKLQRHGIRQPGMEEVGCMRVEWKATGHVANTNCCKWVVRLYELAVNKPRLYGLSIHG